MRKHGKFRIGPQWLGAGVLTVVLLSGQLAVAQDMPPPHKSPRTPVHRQQLLDTAKKDQLKSRDVTGPATIIDNEHLRIEDVDLRLFGVVPPQLSASFGPQARATLDELTRNQNVSCHVRDRDHDGRFLATCTVAATRADLALELLKRGLAVTARGSIEPTELATPYEAAEEAAQAQKLGLWSVSLPGAATAAAPAVQPATATKPDSTNVPPLPSELKKEEKPAAAAPPPAPLPKAVIPAAASTPIPVATSLAPLAAAPAAGDDAGVSGFFARYQLLITGLVMLATAFSIMAVLAAERRRDRRDEMKAIAAALRGELLAARAVCVSRLKSWTESDEKSAAWPRIRATLYQAYVIKIGWLGAVLARQIASIYGQASDYAAYFAPNTVHDPRADGVSKRKALGVLVQHIEEVLPKLAVIEQTGRKPKNPPPVQTPLVTYAPPPELPAPHDAHAATADDTHSYMMAAPAEQTPSSPPLWNIVKRLAPGRRAKQNTGEEAMTDYTALIEEEMARMSSEEESAPPPSNVTKIRGTGV